MAGSTFTFSSRTALASKRTGGSMADEGQKLHDVVLEHVPHHPRLLVEPGPAPHPVRLGHRDLDVVHVAPVP